MAWLRRLGYRGLSMRDLLPHLLGDSDEKVFGITFDDGYRNVYRYAMPVLDEAGFTATNYFVARQLDGANVWDIDKGIPRSPLLRSAEHTSELQSLMRISYSVFCFTNLIYSSFFYHFF